MELSVVIPTHEKADLLARTLAALRRQQLPSVAWEVVVVDDASADGTPEVLERARREWNGRLQVVRAERNVGRAAARNLGARRAGGRWLLFLDDDILAPAGLLAAHLDLLRAGPHLGTIGPVLTDPTLVDAPHFHYIDTRGAAKVTGPEVPERYLVTQNCAVPADDFAAVGGFDEHFEGYGFEDMDLGFRLADERGVRFRLLREPVPLHLHHHTLQQYLGKKRLCGHGALQRIAAVHPGRLREMRLHWVLDPPGRSPGIAVRLFRFLVSTGLPRLLVHLLEHWPVKGRAVPRLAPLHHRCMDVAILASMCQGVSEWRQRHDDG